MLESHTKQISITIIPIQRIDSTKNTTGSESNTFFFIHFVQRSQIRLFTRCLGTIFKNFSFGAAKSVSSTEKFLKNFARHLGRMDVI